MAIKIIPSEYLEYMRKANYSESNYRAEKAYTDEVKSTIAELPDEIAVEIGNLFDEWQPDIDVTAGQRLLYGGKLYKVAQSHHTQEDWTPDKTPALFVEIPKPGEIPVWKQPTGAHDAYSIGDKVHFPAAANPVYESDIDANVYAPDVYGWHVVE